MKEIPYFEDLKQIITDELSKTSSSVFAYKFNNTLSQPA
ncbi:hypothetical protein L1283_005772 [Sphingobacterium sp. HSC-15S19]